MDASFSSPVINSSVLGMVCVSGEGGTSVDGANPLFPVLLLLFCSDVSFSPSPFFISSSVFFLPAVDLRIFLCLYARFTSESNSTKLPGMNRVSVRTFPLS